jgi:aspartate aminotransferase
VKIDGSVAMADYLLEKALLATVPGAAFGCDQFVRFSFATKAETIAEGMNRLKKALADLA